MVIACLAGVGASLASGGAAALTLVTATLCVQLLMLLWITCLCPSIDRIDNIVAALGWGVESFSTLLLVLASFFPSLQTSSLEAAAYSLSLLGVSLPILKLSYEGLFAPLGSCILRYMDREVRENPCSMGTLLWFLRLLLALGHKLADSCCACCAWGSGGATTGPMATFTDIADEGGRGEGGGGEGGGGEGGGGEGGGGDGRGGDGGGAGGGGEGGCVDGGNSGVVYGGRDDGNPFGVSHIAAKKYGMRWRVRAAQTRAAREKAEEASARVSRRRASDLYGWNDDGARAVTDSPEREIFSGPHRNRASLVDHWRGSLVGAHVAGAASSAASSAALGAALGADRTAEIGSACTTDLLPAARETRGRPTLARSPRAQTEPEPPPVRV